MSVDHLIASAQELLKRFPQGRHFYFIDEDFFARPVEEIRQFSEEYSRKIGLPFECLGSPPQITEEKVHHLAKAGLWRVRMGIESGSERTKKEVYHRPISNEVVLRAARIINSFPKLVPYYFFILGNPYESTEDILETLRLVMLLPRPFHVLAFNLVFFPGSLLYERAVKDGLIQGEKDSGYELDFLDGFEQNTHSWKRENVYLNGLLFLAEGGNKRWRAGSIPRILLPWLVSDRVVSFNEDHPGLIHTAILAEKRWLKIRRKMAGIIKKTISHPALFYRINGLSRRK